jgi:lysophospholipase L1-like esterase
VITQTGVRIRFKTSSPTIDLSFVKREGGGTIGASPSSGFTVYVDGISKATFSSLSFTITNPNPGIETTFEVSLPNLWAVDFTGMQLADGYSLANLSPLNKPNYVAIGNSITHGTGQYVSSDKTYPFILANKMGWNLHNLAVAGSTLGWAIALNTKGKKVDVITIKIGFNDWKYTKNELASKKTEYVRLLDSLRAYHPNAKIYCISPIFSSDPSGTAPYTLADFRTMVDDLVTEKMKADKLMCLIKGIDISDATMLASGDPTHLSESGANTFANNLYAKINECILTSVSNLPTLESSKSVLVSKNQLELRVNYDGNYTVNVYSSNGEMVFSKEYGLNQGSTIVNWDGNQLAKGMYILQLIGVKTDTSVTKIIVQ